MQNQKGISNIKTGLIIGIIVLGATAYLVFDRKGVIMPIPENDLKNVGGASVSKLGNSTVSPGGLNQEPINNESIINFKNGMHIINIQTNFGEIQFETYDFDAPKTVQNFITLADKGFYNNLIFHRVIKGFMIQGGDPSGDGTGGPGYEFEDELNPETESYKAGYKKGVVAMANRGLDTNGSQFFIMLEDYPLQKNYTIFGKIIKGQEVVDKIGSIKTAANDRPLEPVIMQSVTVTKKE